MMRTRSVDLLVVGCGAAGVSTAIAAARNGANTLLIDRAGAPGGISATLPWLGFHDRDYRQVVKGFAHEAATTLRERGQASDYTYDPKCGSLVSVDNHAWKCLLMELLEESGVQILLHTLMVDTSVDTDTDGNSRVGGVIVEHKSGREEIRASVLVDCTGDGDVADRAGVRWEKGRTDDGLVQAPTLVFRLGGIDSGRFVAACRDPELNYREWIHDSPDLWSKMMRRLDHVETFVLGGFAPLMSKAREAGDLDVPQTRVVGVKTFRPDELTVVSTRVLGLDPTSVDSLSQAYTRVYRQVPQLVEFFRKYMPGCEAAKLIEIAPMLGVRESRRIMGDYVLTIEDLLAGRRFEDRVAVGAYHVDIHRPKGTWVESRNVPAYTIPYRSLIASGVEGLLMAGKCISATHEAIASTRVIPICMAEGQAAGTAAALAAREGKTPREVDVRYLQQILTAQGQEIGDTLGAPNAEAIEEVGQLPFDEPPTSGDSDEVSRRETAWV